MIDALWNHSLFIITFEVDSIDLRGPEFVMNIFVLILVVYSMFI